LRKKSSREGEDQIKKDARRVGLIGAKARCLKNRWIRGRGRKGTSTAEPLADKITGQKE